MNDPILPPEPTPPAAVQPPAAPQPVQDTARMDRLEQAMVELTNTVRDVGQRLTGPPSEPAPQNAQAFLDELSANPHSVISRVAADAARRVANEQLTPAVLRVLETANTQLLSEMATRVDAEIGAGTFDELFRPQLEKDVAELRRVNPAALADKPTMEALVNRLYGGENFSVLSQRRRELEQLARTRGLSHLVPQGGVPRLRRSADAEPELEPDHELFLREVDRATGENTDRKSFAKLLHTGNESGPGRHRTSIVDYLKATNADAETLKRYGGERQ